MTFAMIGLMLLGLGGFVGWRLATCPVLRTLRAGMGSYATTCDERTGKPEQYPDFRPHDPFGSDHPTVQAARRVA